jgi:hypothetical protein
MRPRAVHLALIAVLLAGCAAPASVLDAYLRAAAGGEADRGWHYLGEIARQSYDDDIAAYLRDVNAADWVDFRWKSSTVSWSDDGFTEVHAAVPSGPASVPGFLLVHHILSGDCPTGEPIGVLVFHDGRPFHGEINAGGLSGGQMACNSEFIGDAAYED